MMKKVRNIGLMIGLIILISSSSKAQYYYTSYGYTLDWNIPQYIHHTIYDSYYGYEIAHVDRYTNHGYTNFNVLLHRNGWFVELRFDGYGHIYKTIHHRNNYPLMAHTCSTHCGYHKTYYATYYPKYHGHHHKTVYVKSNHSHGSHQHNNYYTNVYVEKQHNNDRANQEKVIRISHQSNNRSIESQKSNSDRRISASKSGRGRSR